MFKDSVYIKFTTNLDKYIDAPTPPPSKELQSLQVALFTGKVLYHH